MSFFNTAVFKNIKISDCVNDCVIPWKDLASLHNKKSLKTLIHDRHYPLMTSWDLTLPLQDGIAGQLLATDGRGNMQWVDSTGGTITVIDNTTTTDTGTTGNNNGGNNGNSTNNTATAVTMVDQDIQLTTETALLVNAINTDVTITLPISTSGYKHITIVAQNITDGNVIHVDSADGNFIDTDDSDRIDMVKTHARVTLTTLGNTMWYTM